MTAPYYTDDAVTVWHGDARALPLEAGTVDLIVTSPPYYALRSYRDGGEHYAGQIGDEPTPGEYLDNLLDVTRECVRVLKPSGSLWVNLGDKYAERAGPARAGGVDDDDTVSRPANRPARGRRDVPVKSLLGLPWRYANRCVDELGLILRAEVVWAKPNPMPESVTDRVRRTHETWFHFTLRPRYFAAIDHVRDPYGDRGDPDALGRLPGSVWDIAAQPLKLPPELGVEHYAAFPMEWPRRLILGWSPSGVCTACGEGRRPVVVKSLRIDHVQRRTSSGLRDLAEPGSNGRGINSKSPTPNGSTEARIVGERCGCEEPSAPTRPAVVLDPFAGTGTTGLVARALGRRAHLVDGSLDYCRAARWRVTDPGERARALQVEKPPPVPDGIDSLLDLLVDEEAPS